MSAMTPPDQSWGLFEEAIYLYSTSHTGKMEHKVLQLKKEMVYWG